MEKRKHTPATMVQQLRATVGDGQSVLMLGACRIAVIYDRKGDSRSKEAQQMAKAIVEAINVPFDEYADHVTPAAPKREPGKHTPGPWEMDETNIIYKGHSVATVYDPSDNNHRTPIALANARLIAAAPIMKGQLDTGREALILAKQILLQTVECAPPFPADEISGAVDYISGVIAGNELAIAKAEGKD